MADSQASKLQIIAMTDDHAAPVSEFIRQVWDPRSTPEGVVTARHRLARENVAEPGRPLPTWIAIQGERVLGYVTTIGVQLQDQTGRVRPGYLLKGLMVLPEFRSGPIGYHVLKAAAAALPRSAGLAVAAPALRLFTGLGYRDFGAIPNLVQPLALGRLLQHIDLTAIDIELPAWMRGAVTLAQRTGLARLAGGAVGLAARAGLALGRLPATGMSVGRMDPVGSKDDVDGLWERSRGEMGSAVVRNHAYLYPRYPGELYTWIGAWRGGTLAGLALVREPRAQGDERLRGLRVATLSDIVCRLGEQRAVLALLAGTASVARAMRADALIASASSPALRRHLKRQGFVPLGGNVHLLYRDTEAREVFGTSLDQWFLTRGDGLADEIF